MPLSIEEQIRKAIESGQFDNLPGKGKPLHLEDNPFEDPDWRMAYQVLRNAGFTLPWIEKQREIELQIANARQAIQRSWLWRLQALADGRIPVQVEMEWERALAGFKLQLEEINRLIASLNLDVPLAQFQQPLLNLQHELRLITDGSSA